MCGNCDFFFIRFDIVDVFFGRDSSLTVERNPVLQTGVLQPSALYHSLEKVKPQ